MMNSKFWRVFVCVIAIFVFVVIVLRTKSPQVTVKKTTQPPTQTPTAAGNLGLKTISGKTIYSQHEVIDIVVFADSAHKPVAAYDIVIPIKGKIAFVEAKSRIADFEVYPRLLDNKLLLTGVKKIDHDEPFIFRDEPIVNLTFRAVSPGVEVLTPEFKPMSTNESNIISEETEDVLNNVSGTTVGVGDITEAVKGKKVAGGDREISIKLLETSVGNTDCRDCVEAATLRITRNNISENVAFRVGGIAGLKETTASAAGFLFELGEIQEDRVKLYYAPF